MIAKPLDPAGDGIPRFRQGRLQARGRPIRRRVYAVLVSLGDGTEMRWLQLKRVA
jgi:hypothetical protein